MAGVLGGIFLHWWWGIILAVGGLVCTFTLLFAIHFYMAEIEDFFDMLFSCCNVNNEYTDV